MLKIALKPNKSTFGTRPTQERTELVIDLFNLSSENGMSSKIILFLSIKIAQHRLRGTILHNTLTSFLTGMHPAVDYILNLVGTDPKSSKNNQEVNPEPPYNVTVD